jgi:hypothetical protein
MTDDLSFSYPGGSSSRRAFRVRVSDVAVSISGSESRYRVKDLSGLGLAFFVLSGHDLLLNRVLELDVYVSDQVYLEDLRAKIVRVADDLVGCEFVCLQRWQEFALDKLVLEIQKQSIAGEKNDPET